MGRTYGTRKRLGGPPYEMDGFVEVDEIDMEELYE